MEPRDQNEPQERKDEEQQTNVVSQQATAQNGSDDNSGDAAPPVATEGTQSSFDAPQTVTGKMPQKRSRLIYAIVIIFIAAGAGYYLLRNTNTSKDYSAAPKASTKLPISILRLGTQEGLPTAFYPDESSITGSGATTIVRSVFEGLVGYSDNNKFVPLLASSWTNPDDTTWVFKLKSNVTFHNGKSMTAKDVKASLSADVPAVSIYSLDTILKSVDVVDDTTIKITTNKPDALLLNRLVNIFIYDTSATQKNSAANGTGPFEIKSGTTSSENNITLSPYKKYHGKATYVQEIQATNFADDESLVAALKQDKIDVAFTLTDAQIDEVSASNKAIGGGVIEKAGAYELQPLALKSGSPVQKKQVREALYLAIDPEKVLTASGKEGEIASQIVPKSVTGYNPSITRPKKDVTAAKKLLSDAGYQNGFTLSIFYGPPSEKAVKEIGNQLKEIGVTLDYHPVKTFAEFNTNTVEQKYDLSYSANFSDFSEITDIVNVNLTKNGTAGAYDNANINKLLTEATQEFDAVKRIAILQNISKELMDDIATIPLFVPTTQVAIRTGFSSSSTISDSVLGTYLADFYKK